MIELKIHSAPLHPETGVLSSRTIRMAGGWDELNGEQFLHIAGALYTTPTPIERHAAVCLALLGKEQVRAIPTETLITDVFPLLEWIYEQPEVIKQMLPAVQVGLRKYYGPEGEFNNLRLVEFDFAERELFLFLKSRESTPSPAIAGTPPKNRGRVEEDEALHHLWRFVACLYRPGKFWYNKKKDKDGDVRVKFNENMLNYHARQMRRYLPVGFAYAVHLWYKACRQYLAKLYPVVFNGDGGAEPNPNELPNHFNLIRKIAEKGTYGNYNEVENLYLHTVLLEIEKSILEAEEIKRQSKQ